MKGEERSFLKKKISESEWVKLRRMYESIDTLKAKTCLKIVWITKNKSFDLFLELFFLFPSGARWLQAFLSIREALQNAVFFCFAASFALFEMKTTKHPTLGRLEGLFDWYATYEELNDARWYEHARVCFSDIFSPNSFIYKGFLLQGLGSMLA